MQSTQEDVLRKSWKEACSMHVSELSFDWHVFVTTKFMFQAGQSRLLGDRRGRKSWVVGSGHGPCQA